MAFRLQEMAFSPGLYANRSRRASKLRWVDGNLVRFRDAVPAQVGGWQTITPGGPAITGNARSIITFRPADQSTRFAAIGTDTGAFLYDGELIDDITPTGFVPGVGTSVPGSGYGVGRYGEGLYGTERPATGNLIDASSWSFDMFGGTLLGLFTADGSFYKYDHDTDGALTPVAGSPKGRAICVSDERHVFMFGADGNPGLVRWSDREDFTVWTAAATNRAGGYELQVRSPFQTGFRVRGQVLGLTRTEVFAFTPLQNALVYGRDRVSTEAGIIGPHAGAVVTDNQGELAVWMGAENFYAYDGVVRSLDCDLRDYVFRDINILQGAKVCAGLNTAFDEIWFFYPSKESDEVDRGIIYNFVTGAWSKANITRFAWADAGVFDTPIAVCNNGAIHRHELGATANGTPLGSYIVSHPIMLGTGQQFADVDQWWPDMQDGSAAAKVSFICRDGPSMPTRTVGPFPFALGEEFVPLSLSARELQLRIDGDSGHWELGLPMISMQNGSLR